MVNGRAEQNRHGFTMLEILLAMVILSMISMTIWTTFSNSFRMRDRLDAVEERTQGVRSLLNKMGRDLSMTFLVKEKKYHTLFVGVDDGVADSLTFSTFSNRVYDDDERRSDQVIVSYYTAPNRDEPLLLNVYRWVYPYIEDDQYWGEKRGVLILEKVRRFDIQYYANNEFRPSWDTNQVDFVGKVPEGVKVTLELANQMVYEDLFGIQLLGSLGVNPVKGPATTAGSASPTPNGTPNPNGQPVAPQPGGPNVGQPTDGLSGGETNPNAE